MSSSEESLDIEEPKFDYNCIANDVSNVLLKDHITCACLHSKFFAVGTQNGRIHVFDHEGIKMDRRELRPHLKPVNCISIDDKGEYLVSCSDEKLVVYGLCNNEHNFVHMTDKPTNVVAIDPSFHSSRKFVSGDNRVILFEPGFLVRYNRNILQDKEQKVRTISWHGQFIAWATDAAVEIYDVERNEIITRIKRDDNLEINLCQFCWKDRRTLLVGWGNTVKECLIKERSHEVLHETKLKGLPKKYVEIVSMFETEFVICGLAPFSDNLLTLSINIEPPQSPSYTRKSSGVYDETDTLSMDSDRLDQMRAQVHIIETFSNSYKELSVETPNCNPTIATKKRYPFSLLSLHNEGVYFIIGQKDVILAKPRDYDDHIDWLIKHSLLSQCVAYAKKHFKELRRRTVKEVEELYMEDLLARGTEESFSEAAKLLPSICGTHQESWDYNIQKFSSLGQLKHLLSHIPKKGVDGFHLAKESYDFILEEFVQNDSISFFRAIKEIPCQLYSLQTMADKVIRNLANDPKNLVLNEALAELYIRMGNFTDAVNIYLEYNDHTRIFSLIRNNSLITILKNRMGRLMEIDADETSRLLVENIESIPMRDVVEKLEKYKSKKYLVSYLHRLVLKDADSCIEYHDLMVRLYAQHQPESLLNFLKLSTNYRLEEALRICKEYNLIKEVVFLHGRMGDLRAALKYITEQQGNINEAIEFCKEHQDVELWQDLILYSMDRPEFIGALLKNIDTQIIDPIEIIDRIPHGLEIEGLTPALVKILQDYQLQISLEQSRRDIMAKDCFSLLEKKIRCQTQGIKIDPSNQLCDHCNQPLFNEQSMMLVDAARSSRTSVNGSSSRLQSSVGGDASGVASSSSSSVNDIIIFGCHHVFHQECCGDPMAIAGLSETTASSQVPTCRVCMLETD